MGIQFAVPFISPGVFASIECFANVNAGNFSKKYNNKKKLKTDHHAETLIDNAMFTGPETALRFVMMLLGDLVGASVILCENRRSVDNCSKSTSSGSILSSRSV
jgi:hypothetical protein